jgi:Mechanosensitive ion channel, conserved TM helix
MNAQPLLSAREVLSQVIAFIPALLAGLLVLVIGALAAWLADRIVVRLLVVLRVHRVAERFRWGEALRKGDVRHTFLSSVGALVGAMIFLVFLDRALALWQLTILSQLLERLVFLVPDLIVALVVLALGAFVASVVERAVRRALYEEEVSRARLISRIVRAAILVFTSAIALVQLKVAIELVKLGFVIAFGALALAFVLAVGLGSRRAIELMWEDVFRARRGPERGDDETEQR